MAAVGKKFDCGDIARIYVRANRVAFSQSASGFLTDLGEAHKAPSNEDRAGKFRRMADVDTFRRTSSSARRILKPAIAVRR